MIALIVIVALSRVLLLSSLSPDLAAARGVPVRAVGVAYLVALAISVSLSSVAIGAVLSTALLIGPAATALRIAKRPVRAMVAAALIGMVVTWLGILLAYDSYYWPPHGHGWPVSFFVVALVVVAYLLTYVRRPARRRRRETSAASAPRPGGAGPEWRSARGMFTGLMMNTWIAATIVAVIAGVLGFFAVLRGQSFAAHAIPNGAFAGAAGAGLIGVNTLVGLAVFSVAGALGIGSFGRRARQDVATALILVLMLGIGALFLSLGDRVRRGDLLAAVRRGVRHQPGRAGADRRARGPERAGPAGDLPPAACSPRRMPEVAAARGVSPRRMEMVFLLIMALATSMTVPVVGALLMFSLMIGPAAAARSFTARPWLAVVLSVAFGLVTVWIGIAISYETNWPLGFFVGVLGAAFFLAGQAWATLRGRRVLRSRRGPAVPASA